MRVRTRLPLLFLLALPCLKLSGAPEPIPAPGHDNFRVAVYIPVAVVERMKDPAWLENSWEQISSQVKVDKVYIESYRSGVLADDALLESVKASSRRTASRWREASPLRPAGIWPARSRGRSRPVCLVFATPTRSSATM